MAVFQSRARSEKCSTTPPPKRKVPRRSVAEPAVIESVEGTEERLLTAADLEALPDDLPSGPVLYELDDGRLIIMAPPGGHSGASGIQSGRGTQAPGRAQGARQGEERRRRHRPSPQAGPGVRGRTLFVCNDRLPIRTSPEGYLETIPDLVGEVRSKKRPAGADRKGRQVPRRRRAARVGARPKTQTVTAHRPDQPPRVFAAGDTLTADDVIPDFAVAVADLFRC